MTLRTLIFWPHLIAGVVALQAMEGVVTAQSIEPVSDGAAVDEVIEVRPKHCRRRQVGAALSVRHAEGVRSRVSAGRRAHSVDDQKLLRCLVVVCLDRPA